MVPFRADVVAKTGHDIVMRDLILRGRYVNNSQRELGALALENILSECGPLVESYPAWHPLVFAYDQPIGAELIPSELCGYRGLGHTRYFVNGFITFPYSDGADVIDSVSKLPPHPDAEILAERLDVQLYNTSTSPILVKCRWLRPLSNGGKIPTSIAVRLLLERMIPSSRKSDVPLTWNNLRPELLGTPHGKRSSLFVDENTGQSIKKLWEALTDTGMFGSLTGGGASPLMAEPNTHIPFDPRLEA